ncbi:hypothetical protein [Polaribacter sp. L3A8]|uniref:hypothetical protein n=1 Tax=Polaribacter sp. L3A8 TaxID=2686361 RepID=UPI00131D2ECC|nr:hypothetical protein [Polaribacter sp. L3A8]
MRIKLYYSDNTSEQVFYRDIRDDTYQAATNIVLQRNKRPIRFHISGFVNFGSTGNANWNNSLYLNNGCRLQQRYTYSHSGFQNDKINFDYSSRPIINLTQPNNTLIGFNNDFTVTTAYNSSGFYNTLYNWEYQIVGNGYPLPGSWIDMPNTVNGTVVNGRSSFRIKLSDFISDENTVLGKEIYFRVNSCDNLYSENQIYYDIKKSAPYVFSQSSNVLCYDSLDGSVKINFDRSLVEGEKITYVLKNNTTDEYFNLPDAVSLVYQPDGVNYTLEGDNSYTISGLSQGNYEFKVFGTYVTNFSTGETNQLYTGDANHTTTFTINKPLPVEFEAEVIKQVYCYGGSDGTLEIKAWGGEFTAATNQYYYCITEVGNTGLNKTSTSIDCWVPFTNRVITIETSDPVDPIGPYLPKTSKNKANAVTSIDSIDPIGPIDPIDPIDPITIKRRFVKETITIGAGSYIIKVKDANGCIAKVITRNASNVIIAYGPDVFEDSIIVTEPDFPVSITMGTIANGGVAEPTAFGRSDGRITAKISGGTTFRELDEDFDIVNDNYYNFTWQYFNPNTTTWEDWSDFEYVYEENPTGIDYWNIILKNAKAGEYRLTVKDVNYTKTTDNLGCTSSVKRYTLDEPEELLVTILEPTTEQQIKCFGDSGSLTAQTSGGIAPYLYKWYKVNGSSSELLSETGQTANNLVAGDYKVEVTDRNGNVEISVSAISEIRNLKEPSALKFTSDVTNVTCFDGEDGAINITTSGGTPPYTYQWSDESEQKFNEDRTQLRGGVYNVIITDKNGCTVKKAVNLDEEGINVIQPESAVKIITNIFQPTSVANGNDGVIAITVSGGTGNTYSINWSKNGVPFASEEDLFGLEQGIYMVTVTDSTRECSTTETFIIEDPEPMFVEIIKEQDISCSYLTDGILKAEGSGGILVDSADYSYEWFKQIAGTFTSINQYSITATGLDAGVYKVIIKDFNEYSAENTFTITKPNKIVISYTKQDVLCKDSKDGKITFSVSGGSSIINEGIEIYNYILKGSDDFEVANEITINNPINIENLKPDTYILTVKDANVCEEIVSFKILEPQTKITIDIDLDNDVIDPTAYNSTDGAINNVTVAGGSEGYLYEWFKIEEGIRTPLGITTKDVSGLGDGFYQLTATDSNGCATNSEIIQLIEPIELTVSVQVQSDIRCFEGTGSLIASANGGIGNYSYQWYQIEEGVETELTETEAFISGINSGLYKVKISDDYISKTSEIFTFIEPVKITIAAPILTHISCFGESSGKIVINVSGGTINLNEDYTYLWTKSGTTNIIPSTTNIVENLSPGSYQVRVTDSNGCYKEFENIVINQPATILKIDAETVTNVTEFQANDGSIEVVVAGGIPNYTYKWTKILEGLEDEVLAATGNQITDLSKGLYKLEVVDNLGNGCKITKTFEIGEPDLLTVEIEQTHFNLCFDDKNATLKAKPTGGKEPYEFIWYKIDEPSISIGTEQILEEIISGSYGVKVTDRNGVSVSSDVTLNVLEKLDITSIQIDVSCYGGNTGAIDISVTGGTLTAGEFYRYSWDSGQTTEDISGVYAGDYTLTVTDSNNCFVTKSFTITEPESALLISASTIVTPTANRLSNGSISLTVSGGIAGYTYNWSNGLGETLSDTNGNLENLPEGIYTVLIKDNNGTGCEITQQFNLEGPSALSVVIETTSILCYNGTGQVTATGSGGVLLPGEDYRYSWFTIDDVSITSGDNLIAGDYYVIVKDSNDNSVRKDFNLAAPLEIIITGETENVFCYGGNTGAIDISVTGGTLVSGESYRYSWDSGQTTEDISGVSAGTYVVTVTDSTEECFVTKSFTITEPESALLISASTVVTPTANGLSNGSISLTVSGGIAGYTYNWTNGLGETLSDTNGNLENLPEGIYTVLIKDNNGTGCEITQQFNLEGPSALSVVLEETSILCYNGTGQVTATGSGGVLLPGEDYRYSWFTIDDVSITSGDDLNAGDYYVIVKDSNDNSVRKDFNLAAPLEIIITGETENVSCYGGNTGAIDISVTGGTLASGESYRYSWDSGQTTEDISGVSAGTYVVTVTDSTEECFVTKSFTITEPESALLISASTIVTPTANGLSNGSISLTVSGGIAGYTYNWTNGLGETLSDTNGNLENLPEGIYTVLIKDNNGTGCEITQQFNLEGPSALSVVLEETSILCYNGTGQVTATGSGGVLLPGEDYRYSWFTIDDVSITSGDDLNAGDYYVIVKDSNDNSVRKDFNLAAPLEIIITGETENVSCYGGNTGAIDISVTGGTLASGESYRYSWDSGQTTEDISGVSAGTYVVTVTDSTEECFVTKSFTITEPESALLISASTIVTPTANGLSNGSISLTVSGGIAGYTYNWTNGLGETLSDTNGNLENLPEGIYTVLIKDNNGTGCQITQQFNLEGPSALSVVLEETSILCYNGTGQVTATGSGGVLLPGEDYRYSWFTIDDVSITSGDDLNAGDYYVIVKDSNDNSVRKDFNLAAPLEIIITGETENVSCYGGNTGAIDISVTGGTLASGESYRYSWDSGQTTEDISGVSAGTYVVTVTDSTEECFVTKSFTITEPTRFDVDSVSLIRASEGNADGSISIQIIGGEAPYSYQWLDSAGTVLVETFNSNEITNGIANISEGVYTIIITDNTGCIHEEVYSLTNPGELIAYIEQTENISCFGDSNAILQVVTTGGVGGNSYIWMNSETNESLGEDSEILNNVSAGSYYVIVKNAENIQEQSAVFEVIAPSEIQVISSSENLTCFESANGSIGLTAAGGSGVYQYRIKENTGSFSNWISFNSTNTTLINDLNSGLYKIQVQDNSGCSFNSNGLRETIEIEITEPTLLEIDSYTETAVTGFGLSNGSIALEIVGGTTPYTIAWKNEAGETQASTSAFLENISAGVYNVSIIDAEGCTTTGSYTITEPTSLAVNVVQENTILCFNDTTSLEAFATGGSELYSFVWYDNISGNEIGNTKRINGLSAGNYYVIVTDAGGNTIESAVFEVIAPSEIQVTSSSENLTCFESANGSIGLTAAGGSGVYQYRIKENTGSFSNWISFNSTNTTLINNLSSGLYKIQVQDNSSCSFNSNGLRKTIEIEITEPTLLEIDSYTETAVTGFGLSNGSIALEIVGGTAPYTIVWKNEAGETQASTSAFLENISAGVYNVSIIDAEGCTTTGSYTITEPTPLAVNVVQENTILCFNDTTSLEAFATGGSELYSFVWYDNVSGNEIGNTKRINGLSAGNYYVIVTDAGGNTIESAVFEVIAPSEIQVTSSSENLTCFESANGSIGLTAAGGSGVYQYRIKENTGSFSNWISFNSTNTTLINDLNSGLYKIQVQDNSGCSFNSNGLRETIEIEITEPTLLEIDSYTETAVTGFGLSNGSIALEIVGGTTPYTIAWKNEAGETQASTSAFLENISAGVYNVSIIDAEGCTTTGSYTITEPTSLAVNVVQENTILCFNDTTSLEAFATGGSELYSFVWYDNISGNEIGNTKRINGLSAGNYYVIVTDAGGNTIESAVFEVIAPSEIQVTSSSENLTCFESANGSIGLTAAGGSGVYQYRIKENTGSFSNWISFNSTNTTLINNLSSGLYKIQVQDNSSCSFNSNGLRKTIEIEITEPTLLEIDSYTETAVTGFGLSNGSIALEIVGGTAPYTIVWKNEAGETQASTSAFLENISAGVYNVSIIDAEGCTTTGSYTITEPTPLAVNINAQNIILCNGSQNGSLRATVSGGIPFNASTYIYNWFKEGSAISIGSSISKNNLGAGTYYVVVEDANGNSKESALFELTEPMVLESTLTSSYTSCGIDNDWTIEAQITGGTMPYTYSWNTGDDTATIANVTPGNYILIVVDAAGCRLTESYRIEAPIVLNVESEVQQISCFDACNGEINLTITDGVAPYTILWNTNDTTASISNLCSGVYTVSVTDQKGCEVIKEFTIESLEPIMINLGEDKTLCTGQSLELDIAVDEANVTYLWESNTGFFSTSSNVSLTETGVYTASITNSLGCVVSDSIEIINSNTIVGSEFLMTSQAYVNQEVVIFNVSSPIGDSSEWIVPQSATIVEENENSITLIFTEVNSYEIGLRSIYGSCYQEKFKNIVIEESSNLPDPGDTNLPFILDFTVSPSPNNGIFEATILLAEPSPILLRMFNVYGEFILEKPVTEIREEYSIPFSTNVAIGTYFLVLETANKTQIKKVIIN